MSDRARATKPGDRIGYAARNPAAPEIEEADPIIGFDAAKGAGPPPCLKGLPRPAPLVVCQSAFEPAGIRAATEPRAKSSQHVRRRSAHARAPTCLHGSRIDSLN